MTGKKNSSRIPPSDTSPPQAGRSIDIEYILYIYGPQGGRFIDIEYILYIYEEVCYRHRQ